MASNTGAGGGLIAATCLRFYGLRLNLDSTQGILEDTVDVTGIQQQIQPFAAAVAQMVSGDEGGGGEDALTPVGGGGDIGIA